MNRLTQESLKRIPGAEIFLITMIRRMASPLLPLSNHLPRMVMDFMIWLEMFGNGAATGTMQIIINLFQTPLQLIQKALRKAMIQWNPIHQKEVYVEEVFYVMIVIAA